MLKQSHSHKSAVSLAGIPEVIPYRCNTYALLDRALLARESSQHMLEIESELHQSGYPFSLILAEDEVLCLSFYLLLLVRRKNAICITRPFVSHFYLICVCLHILDGFLFISIGEVKPHQRCLV